MSIVHFLLLLAVVFWGWSFVATKVLLEYLSPVEVMGARLLLGVPPMACVVLVKGLKARFSTGDWMRIAVCGLVLVAHFLIQITGLSFTSATNTGWLIAVTPLTIALLSVLFLKERLIAIQMVGILVATIGVLTLVSRGELIALGRLSNRGDWLILASTFTWAIYTVIIRGIVDRHPPFLISTSVLSLTAAIAFVYMLPTTEWRVFLSLPLEGYVAMIFLGPFCLTLAFWFWHEGVSRLGASRAGFFLYLEPLATTALAVPYLGEPFGWAAALGGVLIVGGVLLAERPGRLEGWRKRYGVEPA